MSRAYKIKLPADLTNLTINKNKVSLDINVLPILDKTRMAEILTNIIKKLGGQQENNEIVVKLENDIIYRIDPENLTLTIDFSESIKNVSVDVFEESLTEDLKQKDNSEPIEITHSQLQNLNENTKKLIELQISNLDKELEKNLVSESFKARQYINQLLKEVYKEAIQEKARSIGNINSITESEENGEYRVRMIID